MMGQRRDNVTRQVEVLEVRGCDHAKVTLAPIVIACGCYAARDAKLLDRADVACLVEVTVRVNVPVRESLLNMKWLCHMNTPWLWLGD
jgi:hypothetical protein